MTFWSDDFATDDVQSPREILQQAADELESKNQLLKVSIDESRVSERVVFAFNVMNLTGVKFNVLHASHRIAQNYPVVIDPPDEDIPDFLKRKRYVPATPSVFESTSSLPTLLAKATSEMYRGTPGNYVENAWVCATPTEFQNKLVKLFGRDYLKSQILSLISGSR